MSIIFREKPGSGKTTREPLGLTLLYTLHGIADRTTAWAYAHQFTAPLTLAAGQVVYRQDVRVDHEGHQLWSVEVPYGPKNKLPGEYRFSFSTTGGTLRIRQSKESIARFPVGAAEQNGVIGGINGEGVEIVIPALKMSYTFRHPAGVVNEALAVNLARKTGRTNSDVWHGFQPGEVLFMGADGSGGTSQESEVRYDVVASENITGQTVGTITGVAKKGWEISWIKYEDDDADGVAAQKPLAVYVERVYDTMSFASVLGF